MQKPMSQAEFDGAVSSLRNWVGKLLGAVDEAFPVGYVYDPANSPISGRSIDEPMRTIAKGIDDVLGSYDALQVQLGLPEGHESRHRRFLSGDC